MKYYGEFVNIKKQTVEVTIVTNKDTTETVEIGDDDSGVWFTTDPVDINGDTNDTFDVMLQHSATISLLTTHYLEDLFCKSALDAAVTIKVEGELIFAGYIEPQAYSQPYNDTMDELQLSCIDAISAMQYVYYENIGHGGVYYKEAKRNAGQRTFLEVIFEGIQEVSHPLHYGNERMRIFYDGSKALDDDTDTDKYKTLLNTSVNSILFLGDETDDVWTYQEIIQEMLRFFNLHMIQVGLDYFIFDWNAIKDGKEVSFLRMWEFLDEGQTPTTVDFTPSTVTLRNEIAADTDAQLNVGEVYNRLELTASVEATDAVIESPLDDSLLKNAFSSKQKYLEELSSDGNGESAYNAFKAMVLGNTTDYDAAVRTIWFAQVKRNSAWTFAGGGTKDIYAKYASGNTNQQDFINALRDKMGAGIISFGSVEMKMNEEDNSPISSVDMENSLFIAVNGNEDDTETGYYPNADDIKKAIPVATYAGTTSGGVFSPPDDDTNNYIVISGKMILNPVMHRTDNMTALTKVFNGGTVAPADCDDQKAYERSQSHAYYHGVMPSRTNDNGRYYAQEIYKATTPRKDAEKDRSRKFPLMPYSDSCPQEYKFQYSAVGESADTISKVPVLCCMLIIGDKCVVEPTMDGIKGYDESTPDRYVWQDYKELSECEDEDEYYAQSFTIGINPKKNDCLIGTAFDIANNIDYTLGIDTEGTAIRIRRTDHVSGAVQFKILGIVNLAWDEITRKHPSFWRHTKWNTTTIPLMSHVASIELKEFEMKLYSDNGMESSGEDNDYVYYSDTDENYFNKKDDLEFKITSAITTAEALEMGVENKVAFSTPQDKRSGDAILTIYDTRQDVTAKAEQLYVDAYYQEYHQPKMMVTQKVMLGTEFAIGAAELWHTLFYHPAPDKTFYPEAVSYNLMQAYATLKLKEL